MNLDREEQAQLDKLTDMIKEHQNILTAHQQKILTLENELTDLETESAVYMHADLEGMARDLAPRIENTRIRLSALTREDLGTTKAILAAAKSIKSSLEKEHAQQTN